MRALRCGGDSTKSLLGMLAGYVRDPGSNTALAGAKVTVEWRAIALDPHVAEVRAIGLDPRSILVDAIESGAVSTTITMSDRTQQLDAVTVIGTLSRESRILDEILRRQRSSFGTVFLPGNLSLSGALRVADVLRTARGFAVRSPSDVVARAGCSKIQVYLNGDPFPMGLAGVDDVIPIRDVLAIEAYPDVAFAPIQWRIHTACAVVAVWTTR